MPGSWVHPAFRPSEGTTTSAMSRRKERVVADPDLLERTSWVDANVAHRQIKKGKAYGNTCALWLRGHLQTRLYKCGCFVQTHYGKVLLIGIIFLSLFCVGLKETTIETDVEKLWIEEGGRLEKELAYTREKIGVGAGTTSQILIQTPKTGDSVLSPDSLNIHLRAVMAAVHTTVDMYDTTWKFSDICYKANFPSFEDSFIDRMLERLLPCIIITPLDCFWEGSKPLGPDHGIIMPGSAPINWTNLHPKNMVKSINLIYPSFPEESVLEVFDRAGIDGAYTTKPCLNPHDPQCPTEAANYHSKQVPDIGAEMTGGCTGFAAKYMKWEEDLIVGGVVKNKSGHIVKAEALQTLLQVMADKDMFEYHEATTKVLNIDWTQDKALKILETWQRKFSDKVKLVLNSTDKDNVYSFSSVSLTDILQEFSQISVIRVVLGYVLMLIYACVSLLRWTDAVRSQAGVGLGGVLLVALSVAAGLGFCSVLQISFNASTTQIIPFLALGLGVDDMFLIAHSFAENAVNPSIPHEMQVGEVLKRTGVSVLLTSVSNMCAFFMAAIIPIPALRAFTLQAAILIIFNMLTILIVFPAMVSLDLYRRQEKRVDVLCCFTGSVTDSVISLQPERELTPPPEYREPSPPPYSVHNTITRTTADGQHAVTVLAPSEMEAGEVRQVAPSDITSSLPPSATSSRQCLTPNEGPTCRERCAQTQRECCSFSLTWFARKVYGPLIAKSPVKVVVVVMFAALLSLGIWGTTQVHDGLDLTDVVPRDTEEFHFLETQSKYFGFYNMYIVTKEDFDYPRQQQLLYSFQREFIRVKSIIKKEDGTLADFWLELFRQWLLDLQNAFDKDVQNGAIHTGGWHWNATYDGILGYKLMVQTGDSDSPINEDLVRNNRLVDGDGIINPDAFYNYLSAWVSNDALAYAASEALLVPKPRQWIHDPIDNNKLIPKSQPLQYAQIPFFLNNMVDTEQITNTITQIRDICDKYTEKGLPAYPNGIPFTFWEQYIDLRFHLMLAMICVLFVTFMVITIILVNPWAAIIVTAVLAMMVVELFGFMGLSGIKLSAVPAVILIVSVGIGVEFTVHICVGFLTAIGGRDRRMLMTLEHMFAPVIHGAISTLLGVIMLVGSDFDFIVRYFFCVLLALVVLGLLNGLVLLPVLLSILGPTAEVVPKDNGDQISPPTPEPSPVPERPVRSISRRVYPRMPSDISLTTITEEPSQYSSHEIIVSPEIVVETTTHPSGQTCSYHKNSSSSTPPCHLTPPTRHVTRVKAKAKVTVEIHTQIPGAVDQDHKYKSKRRRKLKQLEVNTDSGSSSDSSSKCSS